MIILKVFFITFIITLQIKLCSFIISIYMVEIIGIKLLNTELFLSVKEKLFTLLPTAVVEKLTNFKHSANMQRSLWGEILLRKYLSDKLNLKSEQIIFETNEKGKPFLKNNPIHFNITHSGDWILAAFSDDVVGIDVELIHKVNYDIATRFFSTKECIDLFNIKDDEARKSYFFDLWTLKESYLKAIGTGLTKPLNTFTISFKDNNITLRDEEHPLQNVFFRQYFLEDNYKLTVCSFSNFFSNEIKILSLDAIQYI